MAALNLQPTHAEHTFVIDFYYLLPYIRKNIDMNNNVFNTCQENEDFEIDKRSNATGHIPTDMDRYNSSIKNLMRQLEIDLVYKLNMCSIIVTGDSVDEHEYFNISDFNSKRHESDGRIITTDVTKIEVSTRPVRLLLTPPSTSRGFQAGHGGLMHRVSHDRKVKNCHRKSLLESAEKQQQHVASLQMHEELLSWHPWIENLQEVASGNEQQVPFSLENVEESQVESSSSSSTNVNNQHSNLVLKYRNSLLTLLHLLLRNRILSPLELRGQLCNHLRQTQGLALEPKINSLFAWLNANIFFNLLTDVTVEWSYRLKW